MLVGDSAGRLPGANQIAVTIEQDVIAADRLEVSAVASYQPARQSCWAIWLQEATLRDVAGSMFVSARTVQDHLKAIFDKTEHAAVASSWHARAYYESPPHDQRSRVTEIGDGRSDLGCEPQGHARPIPRPTQRTQFGRRSHHGPPQAANASGCPCLLAPAPPPAGEARRTRPQHRSRRPTPARATSTGRLPTKPTASFPSAILGTATDPSAAVHRH